MEKRRRVWDFIKFVSRAEIVGERSGVYFDRVTNEELETRIETAPWSIEGKEFPKAEPQPSLFDNADEVPLTVTIVASDIWTKLTAAPDLAQYLPLGEVLGAISGGRAAGAWARIIGLALCDFWRRNPHKGRLKPTRRELLEFCPPTEAVSEVLVGPNPRYAVQYWANALRILVACDFLEDIGEAAISYEAHRDALPRYLWQEDWLNAKIEIQPGPAMIQAVNKCAAALPEPRPRDLKRRRSQNK